MTNRSRVAWLSSRSSESEDRQMPSTLEMRNFEFEPSHALSLEWNRVVIRARCLQLRARLKTQTITDSKTHVHFVWRLPAERLMRPHIIVPAEVRGQFSLKCIESQRHENLSCAFVLE